MASVFISVGSNIEPEVNVKEAMRLLAQDIHIVAISTFYLSQAVGRPGQPAFYNGVVEGETVLSAARLKHSVLRRIESTLGRRRTEDKSAVRTIDLDLLLYDGLVVQTDDLVIPDPDIANRPFLAVSLSELAPELALPDTGKRIVEIAVHFSGHPMEPLLEFTQELREEIAHGQHQG